MAKPQDCRVNEEMGQHGRVEERCGAYSQDSDNDSCTPPQSKNKDTAHSDIDIKNID